MPKIIKTYANPQDLDIKRCYLPGFQVEDTCPICRKKYIWDGTTEYLSYPAPDCVERIHFNCEPCKYEWQVEVVLRLELELSTAP